MSLPIQIRSTFRENWPAAVRQLAIPAMSLQLFQNEILFLGQYQPLFRHAFALDSGYIDCPGFRERIESALERSGGPVFPRIGYCSWKRSSPQMQPCRTAQQILSVILTADERVTRELIAAISSGDPVWLHLVEWREMSHAIEIRIFIRDSVVIGALAYNESTASPVDYANSVGIRDRVRTFIPILLSALHQDTVIADISIQDYDVDWKVELIELNPYYAIPSFSANERAQSGPLLRFANCQLDL